MAGRPRRASLNGWGIVGGYSGAIGCASFMQHKARCRTPTRLDCRRVAAVAGVSTRGVGSKLLRLAGEYPTVTLFDARAGHSMPPSRQAAS